MEGKKIPLSDLVNMAEFLLKIHYFEFDFKVKKQVSDTTIETKFSPPYVCFFMEVIKPRVCFRYIDIFFIWTESKNKLEGFLQCLNTFHPNLKFLHEKSKYQLIN